MVELNGFIYEVAEAYDAEGRPVSVTQEEELTYALQLEEFSPGVKSYTDEDIRILASMRDMSGLTDSMMRELYEAYFDLVYYGSRSKEWFLKTFRLTEGELCKIMA